MALQRNYWGPSGTLSLAGWDTIFTGPYTGDPLEAPASALGGRVEFVTVDGVSAVKLSIREGDSIVASGYRSQLAATNYGHIIDWVGEGVSGADGDAAYRDYRFSFMVPEQDLSFLEQGDSSFFSVGGVHNTADQSPADTVVNTPFSVQVRPDAYGKLWCSIFRNRDPDQTSTVYNADIHREEFVSWPFRFGEWNDLHLHVLWSYSELGYETVYLNRRLVFSEVNHANCQNNSLDRGGGGNYPQINVYASHSRNLTVYHRGLIVGDKDTVFADMYPDIPGAVPLERVSGPISTGGGF